MKPNNPPKAPSISFNVLHCLSANRALSMRCASNRAKKKIHCPSSRPEPCRTSRRWGGDHPKSSWSIDPVSGQFHPSVGQVGTPNTQSLPLGSYEPFSKAPVPGGTERPGAWPSLPAALKEFQARLKQIKARLKQFQIIRNENQIFFLPRNETFQEVIHDFRRKGLRRASPRADTAWMAGSIPGSSPGTATAWALGRASRAGRRPRIADVDRIHGNHDNGRFGFSEANVRKSIGGRRYAG